MSSQDPNRRGRKGRKGSSKKSGPATRSEIEFQSTTPRPAPTSTGPEDRPGTTFPANSIPPGYRGRPPNEIPKFGSKKNEPWVFESSADAGPTPAGSSSITSSGPSSTGTKMPSTSKSSRAKPATRRYIYQTPARSSKSGPPPATPQRKAPSAPPSAISSLDSRSSSLADGDWLDLDNMSRSLPNVLPVEPFPDESLPRFPIHAKPERTRGGGRRYFKDQKPVDETEVKTEVANEIRRMRRDQYGVLMLLERQGGTFGYGKWFRVENGSEITVNNPADARRPEVLRWKTRHLQSWGDNVEMIGTKGCYGCLGVYFAIKGNRVFCAHMNVWSSFDRDWKKAEQITADDHPRLWEEIRSATKNKIAAHADEYGWQPSDVDTTTIKFTSHNPEYVAHVVASGILEFIGLHAAGFLRNRGMIKAHGFAITPGSAEFENPRGKCFEWIDDPESKGPRKPDWIRIPPIFEEIRLVDDDGKPWGDWCYSGGDGRNVEWHTRRTIPWEWVHGRVRTVQDPQDGLDPLDQVITLRTHVQYS